MGVVWLSVPESAALNHSPALTDTVTFDDLGLPEPLRQAVTDLGFVTPSAIQVQAIPSLLAGRDITGVAQTGTGKTAAFGLPLLATIDVDARHVQALVLTPTRELAMQVADAIESFASHMPGIRVLPVYGGAPYVPQQRALREGVHVVVGTPGRIMDHLERGALILDQVKFLVLDEADEMLRMGFAEDVEVIFGKAPSQRQVALFSATMPPAIRAVADTHLNNPVKVAVTPQASTVSTVEQRYAIVPFRHKIGALTRIISVSDADAAIVFCRTRMAAEEVGSALVEKGIAAATISGDVAQKERERIVDRLRAGALDVLVATDVAARGLDVERIGLVVNFDIPREAEAYVHRIGRTGRAGRTGRSITFVTPHERGKLKHIENTIKARIEEADIPSPRDVSAHKAARVLMEVPTRRAAGRLDLYSSLVRDQLTAASDFDIVDPEKALELASVLLALAVGDDGPQLVREQEEHEAEVEKAKAARAARELRKAQAVDGRGREARDRDRGDRFDRRSDSRAIRDEFGRPRKDFHRKEAGGSRRLAEGTRYRVSVGHKDGINPAGIVGAITGEGGLRGSDIGKIDIFPSFSLVDITAPLDSRQLDRIGSAHVAGRRLNIAEDRGPRGGGRDTGGRSGGYHTDRREGGHGGRGSDRGYQTDRREGGYGGGRGSDGGYDRDRRSGGFDRGADSGRSDGGGRGDGQGYDSGHSRRDEAGRPPKARKPRW